MQTRVDATKGAVIGKRIGYHPYPEERVEVWSVGHDQQIVHGGSDRTYDALDDASTAHRDESLWFAPHARTAAPGLDDAGDPHRTTAP